jgi:large subunit ribosomal protein L4
MELKVVNTAGKETAKQVSLNKDIFAVKPNDHAIYLDVKQHLANKRQGTHKSKERAEIAGSTRKIKKQKGTGTARAGSIKSPLFKGGGRVFGPQPRDYSFKLNKKLKQLARKSALTFKANDKQISIIEDFNFDSPKTKQFVDLLGNLKVSEKKTLFVLNESNNNVYLSSRNLQKTKVVKPSGLSTYEILNADVLILSEASLKEIENVLS